MIRILLSIVVNLTIACWTAVAVARTMRRSAQSDGRLFSLRYFTTDSNVLSGAAALLIAVLETMLLLSGGEALPTWAVVVKFIATAAVTVTFLTVMAFLGPTTGYAEMFADEGLFLHLIGPMLAIVSFCFLDTGAPVSLAQALFGVLPTVLYGTVYLLKVVIVGKDNGGWEDFYGFNKGGKWPVSICVMVLGTFAACLLLRFLHNLAL